jgi:hypothetical protein
MSFLSLAMSSGNCRSFWQCMSLNVCKLYNKHIESGNKTMLDPERSRYRKCFAFMALQMATGEVEQFNALSDVDTCSISSKSLCDLK